MINLLAMLAAAAMGAPGNCEMTLAFAHPDDQGKTTTAVWRDAGAKSLFFADVLHVNTDGTKRSYSVDDFWGETRAVNNLCNAMSDKCEGLDEAGQRARRIATQKAKADGWPAAALAATRIDAGIIPMRNNKPCPEIEGYLVSATALHVARITDACALSSYVDAMTVPAVVVPGRTKKGTPSRFEAIGAKVGDLAVVIPANGRPPVFAVVGDSGPGNELGEGSIALAGAILGKTHPPANYFEVRGKKPYRGQGWDAKAGVLIFPASRSATDPYMTPARIDEAAGKLFDSWGGLARLKACLAGYRRN